MGETIYNMLPDFSGILLAAVGVALVFAPEAVKVLEKRRSLRFALALILVGLGLAGMRSSTFQHHESDTKQAELRDRSVAMSSQLDTANATLKSFGPKLDWIINHPSNAQQSQAVDLKKELAAVLGRPRIEVNEPSLTYFKDGRATFSFPVTNTGNAIAKGKLNTDGMLIGSNSHSTEEELFKEIYRDEGITPVGTPRADMGRGYENRGLIPVSKAFSSGDWADLVSNKKVIYIGLLVTYFDEAGVEYHTERCWKWSPKYESLGTCDGHNKTD